MPSLLEVRDLQLLFSTGTRAVQGVNLSLNKGEITALVGESGCGKSALARAILGLHHNASVTGEIWFEDQELLSLSEEEWCALRGSKMAMIFQDPQTALNPVMRIERQIKEGTCLGKEEVLDLLGQVGIPDPKRVAKSYPHQLSGGMGQRVMIAIALAHQPRLLIADEPTTALDAKLRTQILELLTSLCKERSMALLLITHDLHLVAKRCDRALVMYAGEIVEEASCDQLFSSPAHPYTRALLRCLPKPTGGPLPTLLGAPPDLRRAMRGCHFAERCPEAKPECHRKSPPTLVVSEEQRVSCWNRCPS